MKHDAFTLLTYFKVPNFPCKYIFSLPNADSIFKCLQFLPQMSFVVHFFQAQSEPHFASLCLLNLLISHNLHFAFLVKLTFKEPDSFFPQFLDLSVR